MNTCPHCQKKLLSHASARCNWCGETISNADYQAQAETERAAFFAHQAAKDAESLASVSRINVNAMDPLMDPFTGGLMGWNGSANGPARRQAARAEAALQEAVVREQRAAAILAQKMAETKNCQNEPADSQEWDASAPESGRFKHLEL